MATMKYFYDLMSPPSRALYMLFKLEKIPFESHQVALRKGEHMTNEYKKNVNRFQKVPVIHDNEFILSESVAILRYLAAKGLVSDKWYPTNVEQRARVDEYLEWQHNNIMAGTGLYFRMKWVMPIVTGEDAAPDDVKQAKSLMEGALDNIENIWLAESKFLAGDRISIADLFATACIEQAKITGYEPTDGRQKIKTWMEEVRNIMNPLYDEAHEYAYKSRGFAKK